MNAVLPNHTINQVPDRLLKPARLNRVFMPVSRQRLAKTLSINTPFAFRKSMVSASGSVIFVARFIERPIRV